MIATKETISQVIILGASICEKIKNIYFLELPWIECYKKIAEIFTVIKRNARKFYTDKVELDLLEELVTYSPQDLKEMFEGN